MKVFDLAAARTGLRDREARAAGYTPASVDSTADDHKRYYPVAHQLALRITADTGNGRLLGAQIVGHRDGAVAKRIDTYATALFTGLTVDQISDLDLSYTRRSAHPGTPCRPRPRPGPAATTAPTNVPCRPAPAHPSSTYL